MITLDRWWEFCRTPSTLVLPRAELIGLDHTPPIIVGRCEIQMPSPNQFTYTICGSPSDIGYALGELNRQHDNPYDPFARFRLSGTDDHGVHWMGGWTVPYMTFDKNTWTFRGELENLSTDDNSGTVSEQPGAEAVFLLRVGDLMTVHLPSFIHAGGDRSSNEFEIELLGSKVLFVYEDKLNMILITSTEAPKFGAPYAENWLGEPLRILFGQLIYPRLVARNFSGGRAQVSIRRSPPLVSGSAWAALWGKVGKPHDSQAFWDNYRKLLKMIACDRDQTGRPNFEANKLTRLYEECILAARGSRWVWALTFASSIEALARMVARKGVHPHQDETELPTAEADAIRQLTKHIQAWSGQDRLKDIAVSAVRRSIEITPVRLLRQLKAARVITPSQFDAWDKIRNAVMHGSLVSPFSTKEEDEQLLALAEMLHALTRELLRRMPAEGSDKMLPT